MAEPVETNDELIAKNETQKEDFTMSAMTFEIIRAMIKQVESDVKRIVEQITPVIRPILQAGDVAWRHLKVALQSLRQNKDSSKEESGKTTKQDASVPAT